MTTYAFDATAALSANLIANEQQRVITIGSEAPMVMNVDQLLFYDNDFVITYTDVNGHASTLTLGDDYSFLFEIKGVNASHKVFGAFKINNLQLNGTISVTYRAVGGQWKYTIKKFADFFAFQSYSPRVAFASLKPSVDFFVSGQTTPVVLNSKEAMQVVIAGETAPIELEPVVYQLPNSQKVLGTAGLAYDGNGARLTI